MIIKSVVESRILLSSRGFIGTISRIRITETPITHTAKSKIKIKVALLPRTKLMKIETITGHINMMIDILDDAKRLFTYRTN
jgi:hypothetical protein